MLPPKPPSPISTACLKPMGEAYSILSGKLFIDYSIHISLQDTLTDEDSVSKVILTFKAQKNGDNGASCLFACNHTFTVRCFIRCFLPIVKCFILLLIGANSNKLLCICQMHSESSTTSPPMTSIASSFAMQRPQFTSLTLLLMPRAWALGHLNPCLLVHVSFSMP